MHTPSPQHANLQSQRAFACNQGLLTCAKEAACSMRKQHNFTWAPPLSSFSSLSCSLRCVSLPASPSSCCCSENICEGFDHPDAPPTDKDDAARQLRAATAMEYRRMLSRKPSKKQKKAAAATAAAALANLQPAVSTPAPMETGDADMPGNSSSSSSSRVPLAEQATPEAEPAEASSGSVGMSGSNSKAAAPAEKWQQRLLRLQDLTSSDSLDDT